MNRRNKEGKIKDLYTFDPVSRFKLAFVKTISAMGFLLTKKKRKERGEIKRKIKEKSCVADWKQIHLHFLTCVKCSANI